MDDKDRRKLAVGIFVLLLFLTSLIGEAMADRILRRWALACLGIVCTGLAVLVFVFWLILNPAFSRDLGQFDENDPVTKWYQSLMQPDVPTASCCGEADAYWADSYEVDGDKYVAIITDTRPDEPLRRRHIDIGTKILIPNNKLKYDQSNPTGHGIVFLSRGDYVYCFVAPGGV